MSYQKRISSRRVTMVMALLFGVAAVQPVFAASDSAEPITDSGDSSPSVTVNLINRLVERGVLNKGDSADLLLMAEADAAEARAQRAMTQAALAQAAAAQARLKAVLAQSGRRHASAEAAPSRTAISDATEDDTVAIVPAPRATHRAAPAPARVVHVQPAPVAAEELPVEEAATETVALVASPRVVHSTASVRTIPARAKTAPVPVEVAEAAVPAKEVSAPEEVVPDDTVRVTYVPEVVKAQLREEIKQDVMAQAREENWASPRAFPDWITKIRLFGDVRFRYEGIRFPAGNDNTGAFLNFNAVNTGTPYDTTSGLHGGNFFPTYNVDQNRNRFRLRARLGAEVDLGQNFFVGTRLATGESNSPVTQNQSLGAVGSGQGGNFSKYSIWLDRAFLKYELGGLPDKDFAVSFGRFGNPFFATSMVWADDLGFDGAVAQGRFPLGEDVTPFYTVGAFPVFNTDLNFASNQPSKFKSNDKWLYGSQVGVTWELGKNLSLKLGAAYYLFQNIEGKLSTAYVPFSANDAGDTDATRPAFAQKGNTYMALRNITPVAGDPSTGGNQNGGVNQFQYFGLASKFAVAATDFRLDFNGFEPFQISLLGEFVKNRSFDATAIAVKAENNLGAITAAKPNGDFVGSDTAWLVGITLGDVALKERWKWNVNFNYRKVGSDALVDGFVDSDFGGGGTNLKGFTCGVNLALSPAVKLGLRWMSASEVAGPVFKNDIIQLDFTGKF